ncbi:MAG TPA: hypothetical protein VN843_07980 [Anaerolineales bacterium]|nr:hypothetical protein [Anaerolineales bacterium]
MTPSRQRALIMGLILFGIVIVSFFGWRTFHAFREFRGHRPPPFPPQDAASPETDVELIRDWMTIGFLSHTYRTPPDLLYKALGIRPNGNEHKSLKQLNDEYFPETPGYVLKTVQAEIQARLPPPTEIPPPTTIPPPTEVPPVSP